MFAAAGLMLALATTTPGRAADTGVSVSKAWMRFIIAARPAAGYMTLTNTGDASQVLTGARSPACGMLMLHQTMSKNGSDMMKPVKSVRIRPHGSVSFSPGGYHLMCMSPDKDMMAKKQVPVTLTFSNGGSVSANFDVRGAGGR